jgi:hypothetical protein
LDHTLFQSFEVSSESLAVIRMIYAGHLLLFSLPRFSWIAGTPDAMFLPPPSLVSGLGGFPPLPFFQGLELILCLSAVCLFFGLKTRTASWMLGLSLILGHSFAFSLGKIDHNIFRVLLPLVLSASNWGASCSVDKWRNGETHSAAVESWPVAFFALLVGFGMCTGGLQKVMGGWLSLETQAVRWHLFRNFYDTQRTDLLAPWLIQVRSTVFWEALDYHTVLLELGFFLAAWKARSMRFFCALAVLFHTAIYLIFNILFAPNLIAYSVFVRWHRHSAVVGLVEKMEVGLRGWKVRHVLAVAVAYIWLFFLLDSPSHVFYGLVRRPLRLGGNWALLVLSVTGALFYFYGLLKRGTDGYRPAFQARVRRLPEDNSR